MKTWQITLLEAISAEQARSGARPEICILVDEGDDLLLAPCPTSVYCGLRYQVLGAPGA